VSPCSLLGFVRLVARFARFFASALVALERCVRAARHQRTAGPVVACLQRVRLPAFLAWLFTLSQMPPVGGVGAARSKFCAAWPVSGDALAEQVTAVLWGGAAVDAVHEVGVEAVLEAFGLDGAFVADRECALNGFRLVVAFLGEPRACPFFGAVLEPEAFAGCLLGPAFVQL